MQQILLVEDDRATSDWLASLLAQMPHMLAPVCCATAGAALEWLGSNRPDIVLVDLGLPDRPGADVIRAAAALYPDCDILVITVFGDEPHVVEALSAGASGYLIKDTSLANIREHLAYLRLGGSPMTPRIARMLIRQYRAEPHAANPSIDAPGVRTTTTSAHDPAEELSSREKEVLTGIAKGFTYAEVAAALAISANTVRTHIKHIYAKLAVNSKSEAVWEYNQREAQRGRPPLS
ncbi:MAG: response regulator transcription factor [Comamonadaceae bacterium]|nr:MAG: response regulator transcription factor [Comamonadaceae bacterium]